MRAIIACLAVTLLGLPVAAQTTRPGARVDRVLIISVDGLRPDLLLRAQAPRLHKLMQSGSYTMWARTTAASTTLPSHVSMLTGVVPEVHAIMWNGDLPLSERVYPAVPTIFELARKRGYTTAIATGKSKFNILDKPRTIDWAYFPETPTSEDPEVTSNAVRVLRDHKPNVMVVHLPTVDNVGHARGWGTPEQLEAVARADAHVGTLLDTLAELALDESTVVIVTADHGGAGRTHGPDDPRSRTIPWIISGPGIRQNFDLTRIGDLNVETTDTFATACELLDIPVTRRIQGKFVSQIMADRELLKTPEPPSMQPTTQP